MQKYRNGENTVEKRQNATLKHLAWLFFAPYFVAEINQSIIQEKLSTMNNNLQAKEFSVKTTVMKLALVSGALLSCMYGVLWIFASAFKVLG